MPQKIIIQNEAQLLLALHALQGQVDLLDKTLRACVTRLNARVYAREVASEMAREAQANPPAKGGRHV